MSSKLKQITSKAKSLYKTGKFKKWTDAIKAASKQISGTKKHVDTKSHNVNVKVVSGWRKGATAFIEKNENKLNKFKNIRVQRIPKNDMFNKPGTFKHFSKLAGLFDTSVIEDIDTLKKQYFKLAKIYHPDAGGTTSQFQQLQSEYEKLFNSLLNGSKLTEDQKNNEIVIDEAIRKIIDSIITLPGLTIEVIGKWLWVGGNTYPVYTTLKSVGLSFVKKAGVPYWVYKGVESAGRGKATMEEIRAKYGSQTFNPKDNKKISGVYKINKVKLKSNLLKLIKALNKRPI